MYLTEALDQGIDPKATQLLLLGSTLAAADASLRAGLGANLTEWDTQRFRKTATCSALCDGTPRLPSSGVSDGTQGIEKSFQQPKIIRWRESPAPGNKTPDGTLAVPRMRNERVRVQGQRTASALRGGQTWERRIASVALQSRWALFAPRLVWTTRPCSRGLPAFEHAAVLRGAVGNSKRGETYSPDSSMLATGRNDGTVRMWSGVNRRQVPERIVKRKPTSGTSRSPRTGRL